MAKEVGIEVDGTVTACRGSGFFTIVLDNGHEVLARPSGRLTKNNIRINPDDRVRVEIGPYDLTRGKITYRYK